MSDSEAPPVILYEKAKSARASCKKCGEKIDKGEVEWYFYVGTLSLGMFFSSEITSSDASLRHSALLGLYKSLLSHY